MLQRASRWLAVAVVMAACGPLAATAAEPQVDPTEATRRIERERAWLRAHREDAYQRIGLRDPKWDNDALAAINAFDRRGFGFDPITGDETETMWYASGRAFARGCRDPLVLYVWARSGTAGPRKGYSVADQHLMAADALRDSKYPAVTKVFALARAAQYAARSVGVDAARRQVAIRLADDAIALLPDVFADPDVPCVEASDLVDVFGQVSNAVYGDAARMPGAVVAAAEKARVPPATLLTMRGRYHLGLAWAARGAGWASTVRPEGWAGFEAELAKARDDLSRAWEADPLNHTAATHMLSVETGDSRGRAEMEKWYARAMRAWANNRVACTTKMTWLEPKWHGSLADMVAFGRELRDRGNWDALLPLLLVDAHWTASTYPPGGGGAMPKLGYFTADRTVWDDVHGVMAEYLKRAKAPSIFYRTRYAVIAAWSGHWKEADATFTALGEAFNRSVLPEDVYRALRAEAAAQAADAAK